MKKVKNQRLGKLKKKLKEIKAEEIMTKEVITATEDAHLADIAKIMIKERISGLPVVGKKKKIVGIITAADLFIVMDMIQKGDVMGEGKAEKFNPTVKFAMSTDVVKIRKNTNLNDIIAMVKYKNLHTLPVFEKNRMVGIIGRRDIYKNFYAVVKNMSR